MSAFLLEQLQTALGSTYRLDRELGGGGMSRVFLAHDTVLGRNVVVKVLLPELAAGVSVDRFRREIQLAARLQHPHIVPLLSAGESEGLPYFIMPFIVGESLRVKLAREGELPVSETVRLLRNVASALAYAHGEGVMHRDIKPDNVLLSGGVAVVTDFGVAKAVSVSTQVPAAPGLTSMGVALGTPAYMAPEQASGDPHVDQRADLYALGVMAYEMLTGQPPFAGRAPQAVLAAHVVETPEAVNRRRPAMPPPLADLVMTCLAKRPADRPQSAGEVLHVLDAIATPSGGTATTRVVAARAGAAAGSRRLSPVVAAAIGGTAAVLLMAGGLLWRRAEPTPDTSREVPEQSAATIAGAPSGDSDTVAERDTLPAPVTRPSARPDVPARVRKSVPPANRVVQETVIPSPPPAAPIRSEPVLPARPETLPPPAGSSVPTPAPLAAPMPPAAPARETVPAPMPAPAPRTAPVPTPAPPQAPVVDPRPEIGRTIAEYARAVESRDLGSLRRLYPGMTPPQQRGWEQFFELVREVKAQLTVAHLDVAGGTANARVTGMYTYLNSSTRRVEQRPVAFHATLRRDTAGWRIGEIR